MTRTSVYHALILRSRPSGESNRELWMLTAEEGILRATMFGGPKSRMRSHAAPFHSGLAWVYHDPVRDSRKLSDIDVQTWRPGLRELYERAMAADAVAETVLASHGGGGNWEAALALCETVLDALEGADEKLCERLLICFLFSWARILGIEPDMGHCAHCGAAPLDDELLVFSVLNNAFYCPACVRAHVFDAKDGLLISPGCRRWLAAAGSLPPSQIERITMDVKSLKEAKALTQSIITAAIGRRLASCS